MGTPIQYYVDPSLGSDTGDGTVGTPWGRASGSVVQYALDTGITRDATHGDQINVKAGTDDTLGAAISTATYGAATEAAPLIIRGYTTAANDGGIGGISGAATYAIISTSEDVSFIDMHLHNCAANTIVAWTAEANGMLLNCELDTTTTIAADLGASVYVKNCNIHTFGTFGIDISGSGCRVVDNYISDAAATAGINVDSTYAEVRNNIITIAGATDGITLDACDAANVVGNSILSAAGTGKGIERITNRFGATVINNLVEGFSGAGGTGIDLGSHTENVRIYAGNVVSDCTTKYSVGSADFIADEGDNEDAGTSALFAKSGSDTFANRLTYFAPADVGNILGGAY